MAKENFDYSKKAAELDRIVAKLQNPDIQIDEATRLHSEGLKLVAELEKYLETAEIIIKKHVASTE